jgi:hypothetical protein
VVNSAGKNGFASIAGLYLLHNQPPRNPGICRQFGMTPAVPARLKRFSRSLILAF